MITEQYVLACFKLMLNDCPFSIIYNVLTVLLRNVYSSKKTEDRLGEW